MGGVRRCEADLQITDVIYHRVNRTSYFHVLPSLPGARFLLYHSKKGADHVTGASMSGLLGGMFYLADIVRHCCHSTFRSAFIRHRSIPVVSAFIHSVLLQHDRHMNSHVDVLKWSQLPEYVFPGGKRPKKKKKAVRVRRQMG